MKVKEWMTTDVKAIRAVDSLQHAALAMWTNDIGAMPVLGPEGKVVGMITDRDIAMAAALRRKSLENLDVQSTMSRELWYVAPDDTLGEAEQLMCRHQVRRLPVVDAVGKLVGIVTFNDIARSATAGPKKAIAGHIARAIEAIATPRHAVSLAK
jgi:CBS domain-containing protein